MFQIFCITILTFISLSAQAMPSVGDFAQYDYVADYNGDVIKGTIETEILEKDEAAGRFKILETLIVSGEEPDVVEYWKDEENLITDEYIDAILGDCTGYEGTEQTITVPAGTFNTCLIEFRTETTYASSDVAKVPFGFVTQEYTYPDARHTWKLKKFRFAGE
ncbi:MAG: hypothetical protein AB7O96_18600 [Pseudobdellovibrionaceae bacterium]